MGKRLESNKKRLPIDLVVLSLAVAIGLLFVYALKISTDHNSEYYNKPYEPQSLKIDSSLIDELQERSNNINVLSNTSVIGSIDPDLFSENSFKELPETQIKFELDDSEDTELAMPVIENELSKPTINTDNLVAEKVDTKIVSNEVFEIEHNNTMKAVNSSESWLLAQPKNNYSLQLASFKDSKLMDIFINKQADIKDLDYKKLESKNGWVYLLVGSFTNNQDAEIAKQAFSFSNDIWVRKIGVLRANRCKNKGLSADHPSC